jgi:metallo-beta-lactamase family protein
MQIQMFGAAKRVTGSCYSLTVGTDKILIDCGMFQGNKQTEKLNYENFQFDPKEYKALILTHAHLDHCGRIPKLIKNGFKGKIYATEATKDLACVVMLDSANIALHDCMYENKRRKLQDLPPREPIYTELDVKKTIKLFQSVEFFDTVQVTNSITAKFYGAGHILGASSVKLQIIENKNKKTIVFSGDVGQLDTPIVKNPAIIDKADYCFIESTYGNRLHPPIMERKNEFLRVILDTYKKRGKVLIPSFAIERAQELLYNLNEFAEKNIMPKMKVFIDSPMAIKSTEVFKKHPECYSDELNKLLKSGDDPFSFPGLVYSNTVDDSKSINNLKEPCIIIAGSGMCTAGRIKHHIKNYIDDPKNTIVFVGYQVFGTLGYWIKSGQKRIKLLGTQKFVRAKVESIDSFSAHADYNGLINWLRYFSPKPKKVFITHGDEKAQLDFKKKLDKLKYNTYIPGMSEIITL